MRSGLLLLTVNCLLLTAFSSCVKEDLYNTPHPDKGQPTIDIDWTDIGGGKGGKPDTLVVIIDKDTIVIPEGTKPELPLIDEGDHDVTIHNKPDGVEVEDGKATVDVDTDGNVKPDPDDFISDKGTITVKPDGETEINIKPVQRMRQLTILLTVTEGDPTRIASISGTMSNIARSFNIQTNTEEDPATVAFAFAKATDKFSTTMRLFGIIGSPQTLKLKITFADGSTQLIEKDLSSLLAGFNADKATPKTVSADIQIGIDMGFSCNINNWVLGADRPGTAD